jgi:hypothetical protein
MDQQHSTDLLARIREYRSNEANFEELVKLLESEIEGGASDPEYREKLQEIKEKQAAEYRKAKEGANTAWPEFEQFFSQFETAVLAASKRS